LRVPRHPLALALLEGFAGALAAPSANRFGRISPTRAEHVAAELGDKVDLILDGGDAEVGLESTIVDLSVGVARVLRPGAVRLQDLAGVLGYEPELVLRAMVRASGMLESHYAPHTPALLLEKVKEIQNVREIPGMQRIGVIARRPKPSGFAGNWLTLPNQPEGYGKALYAALRDLDGAGLERIYIEAVPETEDWLAVRDRLRRATSREKVL
jgi:L-threonylcarbamoyladenylate synthase